MAENIEKTAIEQVEEKQAEETTTAKEGTTAVEETAKKEESESVDEGDDDLFTASDWMTWDDDETETKTEESSSKGSEEKADVTTESDDTDSEWWKVGAKKLGIDANSEEEFLDATKQKEVFVDANDKVSAKLKSYLDYSDENLLRAEYEALGWDKKDIDKAVSVLDKNGNLELEAIKVRNSIKGSIKDRQVAMENERKQARDKELNFVSTVNNNVSKAIEKTEKIFGFKVAKDTDGVSKWKSEMTKYITAGSFQKEIQSITDEAFKGNPERMIELAQFLRGKDGIVRGLVQKGKGEKAEEFLKDLRNSSNGVRASSEGEGKKGSVAGWF
jgi:hypothetical protein